MNQRVALSAALDKVNSAEGNSAALASGTVTPQTNGQLYSGRFYRQRSYLYGGY